MDFEEKVKSMTGKQILGAMIEGLKRQYVRIDMASFGRSDDDGICYGCAATNAILHICKKDASRHDFYPENAGVCGLLPHVIGCEKSFIDGFEQAIDSLRNGNVENYNFEANLIGIADLPIPENDLPRLNNDDWQENIIHYYNFYKSLK